MENSDGYISIDQAGCRLGGRVKVSGIVSEIKDHGGLLFIDIKDKSSLIKAMVIPDNNIAYAMSQSVEKGFLVEVEGLIKECPVSVQDTDSRGNIEIEVEKMSIISARDDEEYNRLIGILAKISSRDEKKIKKIRKKIV